MRVDGMHQACILLVRLLCAARPGGSPVSVVSHLIGCQMSGTLSGTATVLLKETQAGSRQDFHETAHPIGFLK